MQLARRARTEIVLSFDQVMVRSVDFAEFDKVDATRSLPVHCGLACHTYMLRNQILGKDIDFGFEDAGEQFQISKIRFL